MLLELEVVLMLLWCCGFVGFLGFFCSFPSCLQYESISGGAMACDRGKLVSSLLACLHHVKISLIMEEWTSMRSV